MVHQIALKAAKSSSHNAIFRDQKSIRGKPQISSVARPFGISNDHRRTFRAPKLLVTPGKSFTESEVPPGTRDSARCERQLHRPGAHGDAEHLQRAESGSDAVGSERADPAAAEQAFPVGNQGCVRPLSFPLGVTDTGAWLFRVVSPYRDARTRLTSCSDHPSR